MKQIIQPDQASRPKGSWSQGVKVGDLLFVAGQVGENEEGVIIHPHDAGRQAELAFANIRNVVESAGGVVEDITKITAFLVNVEDFPAYDRARRQFFGQSFPASSTVIVKALANPDFLLEIEAIAVIGASTT
jgi:reactive intermediate/imine deaminase